MKENVGKQIKGKFVRESKEKQKKTKKQKMDRKKAEGEPKTEVLYSAQHMKITHL